jgi:hypothetical protein
MGPECAGTKGGYRKRYRTKVRSQGRSYYAAIGHIGAATPILFTLFEERQYSEQQPLVEEVLHSRVPRADSLMHFPSELIDLVLSAPSEEEVLGTTRGTQKRKNPRVQYVRARFCRKFAECASI